MPRRSSSPSAATDTFGLDADVRGDHLAGHLGTGRERPEEEVARAGPPRPANAGVGLGRLYRTPDVDRAAAPSPPRSRVARSEINALSGSSRYPSLSGALALAQIHLGLLRREARIIGARRRRGESSVPSDSLPGPRVPELAARSVLTLQPFDYAEARGRFSDAGIVAGRAGRGDPRPPRLPDGGGGARAFDAAERPTTRSCSKAMERVCDRPAGGRSPPGA